MVFVPCDDTLLQQHTVLEPAQHSHNTSVRVLASRARWEHHGSLGGLRHTPAVESDATAPVTNSRDI